jgi:hypothetical protein
MVLAMDFRRQAQVCARLAEDCEDQRLAERFRKMAADLLPIKTPITIPRYIMFAAVAFSPIRWAPSVKTSGLAIWPGGTSYEKRPSGVGRIGASRPATQRLRNCSDRTALQQT